MAKTARFFSTTNALVSVGLFFLGLLVGSYCVYRVVSERVLSIGGFFLAGALLVAGVGLFATAVFKKGCAACRRPFVEAVAQFASQFYDHVAAVVATGNPAAIPTLAAVPRPMPDGHAVLEVSYCPSCRRVGEVRVYEERNDGQYGRFVRGTERRSLDAEAVHATLGLIKHRSPAAVL